MINALVNGIKTSIVHVKSGDRGLCPICDKEVVACKGQIKVPYWRHLCNEHNCLMSSVSDWHLQWQYDFSILNYETEKPIEHNFEKHIADVFIEGTPNIFIEFQHSNIKPVEVDSRNNAYKNVIWVIDYTDKEKPILAQLGKSSKPWLQNHNIFQSSIKTLKAAFSGRMNNVCLDYGDYILLPTHCVTNSSILGIQVTRSDFIRNIKHYVDAINKTIFDSQYDPQSVAKTCEIVRNLNNTQAQLIATTHDITANKLPLLYAQVDELSGSQLPFITNKLIEFQTQIDTNTLELYLRYKNEGQDQLKYYVSQEFADFHKTGTTNCKYTLIRSDGQWHTMICMGGEYDKRLISLPATYQVEDAMIYSYKELLKTRKTMDLSKFNRQANHE